jgi:hypothetical protein
MVEVSKRLQCAAGDEFNKALRTGSVSDLTVVPFRVV